VIFVAFSHLDPDPASENNLKICKSVLLKVDAFVVGPNTAQAFLGCLAADLFQFSLVLGTE
jgi:hypothetical protein